MWNEFLAREYFGNSMTLYMRALLIVGIGLLVLLIAGRILKKRIEKLEARQQGEAPFLSRSLPILKLFHRIILPLAFLGVLGAATSFLNFDEHVRNVVNGVFATIMTIIIVRSVQQSD